MHPSKQYGKHTTQHLMSERNAANIIEENNDNESAKLMNVDSFRSNESNDNKYDREFILGLGMHQNDNYMFDTTVSKFGLEPQYITNRYVYLNKPITTLSLNFDVDESAQINILKYIVINEHDNGYGFTIGAKSDDDVKLEAATIDDFQYLKKIKMQYFYKIYGNDGWPTHRKYSACGINYIELHDENGNQYQLGQMHNQDDDNEYVLYNVEETGHLFIAGCFVAYSGIVALQIIDLINVNKENMMYIFRMSKHDSTHSKEYKICNIMTEKDLNKLGKHCRNYQLKWCSIHEKYPLYFENIIGVENEDVVHVFQKIVSFCIEQNDPTNAVFTEYLKIIQNCIDGDMSMIHSIFTIGRFLNDVIQTEFQKYQYHQSIKNVHFDSIFTDLLNDESKYKFILKIQTFWQILCEEIKFCKRVNTYSPSFNIYTLTFLQNSVDLKVKAVFVFVSQLLLFTLLVLSLQNTNVIDFDAEFKINDYLYCVFAVIITCVIIILVRTQIQTFTLFNKTFGIHKIPLNIYIIASFVINCIICVLLVPFSFIIIMYSDTELDLVLNSLASLFILELDDQVIDLNAAEERSLYLEYIATNMFDLLSNIDRKYKQLINQNWHYNFIYPISYKSCDIDWPKCANYATILDSQASDFIKKMDMNIGFDRQTMFDASELPTLNQKYLKFRLINQGCGGFVIYLRKKDEDKNLRLELVFAVDHDLKGVQLRRRGGNTNQNRKCYYGSGTDVIKPPFFGTWFCLTWSNNKDGRILLYYNMLDCNPDINDKSENTKKIIDVTYSEYFEDDPIKLVGFLAWRNSAKIIFYK